MKTSLQVSQKSFKTTCKKIVYGENAVEDRVKFILTELAIKSF